MKITTTLPEKESFNAMMDKQVLAAQERAKIYQPMKRILPLPKHVLIQLEDSPESSGGVYIPSASRDPESIGRVLEIGKDCPDLSVGTRVYVKTNHGTGLGLNGRKCVMMPYRDVLAVIQ